MATSAAALVPLGESDNIIPFPRPRVRPVKTPRRRFGTSRARTKKSFDISFPCPGEIAFHSGARFATWNSDWVRKFIETSFSLPEVSEVEIDPLMETATLRHQAGERSPELLHKLSQIYQRKLAPEISASFPVAVFRAIPQSLPRLRAFRHGDILAPGRRVMNRTASFVCEIRLS